MHQTLEIFRLADGLARHAGARQELVARNVAHADTPGYRATDLAPFERAYDRGTQTVSLRASRPGHLAASVGTSAPAAAAFDPLDTPGATAPNGNTVSIEAEMVKASEVRHQHELALSVYQSALGILRTSLGRAR